MKNSWHLLFLIIGFVTGLLVIGTAGYHTIEPNWSLSEAFYMSVITISTVGFTEIHPLSTQGRYFTVFLIFLGIFVISIIGTCGARLLIDNELKNILGRKKMKKEIAKLKHHYVVCGFGRIGSVICQELHKAGREFVIIEKDDALIHEAESLSYRAVKGDATSDAVLKEAGLERALGVVAALDSDAQNLFISLAAREINSDIKIIARGEEFGVESRLLRAGANVVVSPLKLGGCQIAHMILEDQQPLKHETAEWAKNLTLHQIQNTQQSQMRIDDLLQQANAVLAVAIQRSDGRTEMMPSPETILSPNDTVYVCQVN